MLHELAHKDLRAIVSEGLENSALQRQVTMARLHGIDLQFTSDALDAIAKEAYELGTGARGLHRLIGRAVDGVDYRWAELANEGVTRVEIGADTVLNMSEPIIERGKKTLPRCDAELREEALSALPPRPTMGAVSASPGAGSIFISDSRNWSEKRMRERIENLKTHHLDWENTTGSARVWWKTFEEENKKRPALILRLTEELAQRSATVSEFFLSYVYSNTDNIQANLHFLDYQRLKEAKAKNNHYFDDD